MAELLSLRGRNALSPFRIAKLLSNLAGTRISGVVADFWHFVDSERKLTAAEHRTLVTGDVTSVDMFLQWTARAQGLSVADA